jgi:methionyl-tRNA formyltransferase
MNILYFGRKSDKYSIKLYEVLIKNNSVNVIWSNGKKNKIDFKLNKKIDFIICFRSHYLLKKKHLKLAKIAAINFHPGTTKYRGIGCINLALLKKEKMYGSTAHLMNTQIDNGKIIDVKYFKVKKNENLSDLLDRTHKNMFNQSKKILNLIIKNPKALKYLIKKNNHIKWSKNFMSRKKLNDLYKINLKRKNLDIDNIIRSLSYKHYKPIFTYNGFKFNLL